MRKSMARFGVFVLSVGLLILVGVGAWAHPGHHDHGEEHEHDKTSHDSVTIRFAQADAETPVSGDGDFRFRVLYTSDHLPDDAVSVLVKAHGGFAVDRREDGGQIYFALPGAGIIELSPDLSSSRMVPTPGAMRDTNMHNTTIWYGEGGRAYLAFPANDAGKVFTTTTDGDLVDTLEPPQSFEFDVAAVNTYFEEGGKFVPTDVEFLQGLYYITTGYSPLDYVLTAKIEQSSVSAMWNGMAFGGKGSGPGEFGTGHGITVTPDNAHITVADRPNAEIDRFTPGGDYLDTIHLPEGSYACDIDYTSGYAVVGCLHGPDREKGAPIYVLEDGEVISTVMPKEELGLSNFQHIHNAVMIKRDGKFYIIAQAWNPGDFAILEQVVDK